MNCKIDRVNVRAETEIKVKTLLPITAGVFWPAIALEYWIHKIGSFIVINLCQDIEICEIWR